MRGMFDTVPDKYALLNKVLTFGRDEIWRSRVTELIRPDKGARILDICTGTGDLALRLAREFPASDIYAVDFSPKMLYTAKNRAALSGAGNLTFREEDCRALGFEGASFDYVTVSFGFRNLSYSMANLSAALKEIFRVLKDGGRFIILETSQPENALMRGVFHLYARTAVPFIGSLIAGNKEPYRYLGASIAKFFDRDGLVRVLASHGFRRECILTFAFGAIALSVFRKSV